MEVQTKTCKSCGKPVRGRSDKKFCDDYCRNHYNNQLKAGDNHIVRNINNALKKNRRILQELLPPGEEITKVQKNTLLEAGFRFRYFTHSYTNKKGNTYFYCYEYGYLPLEHDRVLVVRMREDK